ncbi:MAG: hypothetical protein FWB85_07145 [Chitinispirillia bacterium]|nr:hypothetical protein [Chitinispirillia bacterium]MCL2242023.1 hypothetical protein [Chitinispirillia bacterium]
MGRLFKKCVAGWLIACLALSVSPVGTLVFAYDDWGDYDSSFVPEADSAPHTPAPAPSYSAPAPSYSDPSPPASGSFDNFDDYIPEPQVPDHAEPAAPPSAFDEFDAPPPMESLPSFDAMNEYAATVDAASEGFIKVVRAQKREISEFQNAVIEGLQVTVEENADVEDEITVTCYFIFRDRPTSFFYDVDRKDNKLTFEFVDARTGSSPIAALEQPPIREIVIEEAQVDANKSIKGLNPEWHDVIRVSFDLEYLPVISVSNEHTIISFSYKWTKDPAKIKPYLHKDKFPLVFWVSGGTLGAIGIGVLTYFLIPKEDKTFNPVLSTDDLPNRVR